MRRIAVVTAACIAFIGVVSNASNALSQPAAALPAAIAEHRPANDWRRTALGWERRAEFCDDSPPIVFASFGDFPHPAVIAALQGLLSLAALIYFKPVGAATNGPLD